MRLYNRNVSMSVTVHGKKEMPEEIEGAEKVDFAIEGGHRLVVVSTKTGIEIQLLPKKGKAIGTEISLAGTQAKEQVQLKSTVTGFVIKVIP